MKKSFHSLKSDLGEKYRQTLPSPKARLPPQAPRPPHEGHARVPGARSGLKQGNLKESSAPGGHLWPKLRRKVLRCGEASVTGPCVGRGAARRVPDGSGWIHGSPAAGYCTAPWRKTHSRKGKKPQPARSEGKKSVKNSPASSEVRENGGRGGGAPGTGAETPPQPVGERPHAQAEGYFLKVWLI